MGNNLATFADFQKLQFRVGKVLKVEKISGSEKLIKMQIDLGQVYGQRQIIAAIAQWYTTRQLKGKKFIFVTNLEPKKMMGDESCGMMIAADVEGVCKLLPVDKSIPEGAVVR